MTSGQLRAAVAHAVLAADPDAASPGTGRNGSRMPGWSAGPTQPARRIWPGGICPVPRLWPPISGCARSPGPGRSRSAPPGSRPIRQGSWPARRPEPHLLRARAYLALLLGQPVGAPPADLLPSGAAPGPHAPPGPGAHYPAPSPLPLPPAPGFLSARPLIPAPAFLTARPFTPAPASLVRTTPVVPATAGTANLPSRNACLLIFSASGLRRGPWRLGAA